MVIQNDNGLRHARESNNYKYIFKLNVGMPNNVIMNRLKAEIYTNTITIEHFRGRFSATGKFYKQKLHAIFVLSVKSLL